MTASITEKVFIEVNGSKQGMFIQSKNVSDPVLLYLHGGLPEYFLTKKYPTGLEKMFTVVWWEQRGSGISYNASKVLQTITQEQMISDTMNRLLEMEEMESSQKDSAALANVRLFINKGGDQDFC